MIKCGISDVHSDRYQNLTDEPTEGFYKDNYGNDRNMFQDISKGYHINGVKNFLACFNIENESQIKRTVI